MHSALCLLLPGCKSALPSNDRDWSPDMAVLPYALEIEPNVVEVKNVRNCRYVTDDDYVTNYYDKRLDLRDVRSVDFIVIPFADMPAIAHTMLSFGFRDDYYLCTSAEIRREKGEAYSPWKGSFRQYELMYVLGDERDLVQLRTNSRKDNVYVHRTLATPQQSRALLEDVLRRANELRAQPEFYDTLTNNCTTSIWSHVDHVLPDRVPFGYQVLLSGKSDKLAYDRGFIVKHGTFEETRRYALVTPRAQEVAGREDFSALIRR